MSLHNHGTAHSAQVLEEFDKIGLEDETIGHPFPRLPDDPLMSAVAGLFLGGSQRFFLKGTNNDGAAFSGTRTSLFMMPPFRRCSRRNVLSGWRVADWSRVTKALSDAPSDLKN
jgi:hypothetical protein